MSGKLQKEIQQQRPFRSLEEEVFLNLLRTADRLGSAAERTLAPARLSLVQYNVLRILRGAAPDGLPCGEVGARLLTRDPDVTRLLDRLAARGLVGRSRGRRDRRVVTARITPAGLALLARLDRPAAARLRRLLSPLGRSRLRALSSLLEAARARTG
jgi:DNA-binding MarR family transcriptional regulator